MERFPTAVYLAPDVLFSFAQEDVDAKSLTINDKPDLFAWGKVLCSCVSNSRRRHSVQ
jgi:hypothetical protein